MSTDKKHWPLAVRVAFRFCVSFFAFTTLYLAVGYISDLLHLPTDLHDFITDRVLFAPFEWTTKRIFGNDIVYATLRGFIAYFSTALAVASLATIVWSVIDRRRLQYRRLHAALRVYLRYLLAAVALGYGAAKVIPSQFPPPSLIALVTPLGEFTRMRLLWHFMGTSTLYEVFCGLIEVSGGVLLLWRRTTALGALVLAAGLTNVAVLNFAYDVGVRLNATIYVLMALALLAPDARRLANLFLLNEPVPPSDFGRSATAGWRRRVGHVVKATVVVVMVGESFRTTYVNHLDSLLRPALYGIYDVEEFSRGGILIPAGGKDRWQRFIVSEGGVTAIQWTAGGVLERYQSNDDTGSGVLTLTAQPPQSRVITLRYTKEPENRLLVAGRIGDADVQARLRAVDVTKLPLRGPRR